MKIRNQGGPKYPQIYTSMYNSESKYTQVSEYLPDLLASHQCGVKFAHEYCLYIIWAIPLGSNIGCLMGWRSWNSSIGMLLGNAKKGIKFRDLVVIVLWGTILLGLVKGCFKLMLLAVYYFWCISGVFLMSSFYLIFLLKWFISQMQEGCSQGLHQLFVCTTVLRVPLIICIGLWWSEHIHIKDEDLGLGAPCQIGT